MLSSSLFYFWLYCIEQFVREDRKTILLPQVHYFYRWKREIVDPVRERETGVFPHVSIIIRFERWGGGTEYYSGLRQFRPHDRNITCIEPETLFLLICMLMLLIYNHKAELINRGKNC